MNLSQIKSFELVTDNGDIQLFESGACGFLTCAKHLHFSHLSEAENFHAQMGKLLKKSKEVLAVARE